MKARPIRKQSQLPHFAVQMTGQLNVPYWNIGVDVVYYRNGKDRIGFHGDDDQGDVMNLAV